MPNRLIRLSQTDPARSILGAVSTCTIAMEVAATIIAIFAGLPWYVSIDLLLVAGVSGWACRAAATNNLPNMARSSFWLFILWLWTGLSRLAFSPDPSMLLWAPMVVVALSLAIVYVYLMSLMKEWKEQRLRDTS